MGRVRGAERTAKILRILWVFIERAQKIPHEDARKGIANLVVSGCSGHFTGGGAFAIMAVKQGESGRRRAAHNRVRRGDSFAQ